MSALSKHSPAKRNGPNTSGWQTPFPAEPELVAEPGWECPHNVCGGGLALKLRRNGKDEFVVCTKQVYKDPTTCQFTCSFFRPSKDNPHISLLCTDDVGGIRSLGEPTKGRNVIYLVSSPMFPLKVPCTMPFPEVVCRRQPSHACIRLC